MSKENLSKGSRSNISLSKSNISGSKSNISGSKSSLLNRSMSGSLKNIRAKDIPAPVAAPNDQPVAPSIIYENTFKTKPDRK